MDEKRTVVLMLGILAGFAMFLTGLYLEAGFAATLLVVGAGVMLWLKSLL